MIKGDGEIKLFASLRPGIRYALQAERWWLAPVTPTTWEAEIGRIVI
jgi:hypothetical protein